MEQLGYLPPEGDKNAAPDGAAEGHSGKSSPESIVREGMSDSERFEALKNRTIRVVSDTKSSVHRESLDLLSLIPRAKKQAEQIIIPLAQKLGILNRSMKTPEVDVEFQFSKNKGLKESTQRQLRYGGDYADFAKALINIDEVLENAVLVEKHADKYKGTTQENRFLKDVSVLFGAFSDGKSIIPVQFEIKKHLRFRRQALSLCNAHKSRSRRHGEDESPYRDDLLSGIGFRIQDIRAVWKNQSSGQALSEISAG